MELPGGNVSAAAAFSESSAWPNVNHAVVVVQLARTAAFLDPRHRIERHQFTVAATDLEPGDVGRRGPLVGIESQDDIVQLVVRRESADVAAA
jgi:hypothetical protein